MKTTAILILAAALAFSSATEARARKPHMPRAHAPRIHKPAHPRGAYRLARVHRTN